MTTEARESATWIENRPTRGWLPRFTLRELYAARELALVLAVRDIRVRYAQTFFGIAWAIIQPLAAAALFSVVFGHFAHVPSDSSPYLVFAYSALTASTYLSTSVSAAAESLVQHRSLVTKIYFPRILAPIAALLPGLVDFGVSLVLLAIFMAVYGVGVTPALVMLPVWIAAAVAVALAAGTLLAALNVRYRDVRYALPFILQLWFFASPVVYPSSLFHGIWRYVYSLNPAVGLIDGFRWSAIGGRGLVASDVVSLAAWIVLLAGGLVYFGRVERRFADQI